MQILAEPGWIGSPGAPVAAFVIGFVLSTF